MTTSTHPVTITHERVTTGQLLYGGTTNRYYAAPEQRRLRLAVETNGQAYRAHLTAGREYQPGALTWAQILHASPLFTTEAEGLAWLDAIQPWAETTMRAQTAMHQEVPPVATDRSITTCPQCGGYNTLSTALLSYGNLTTCSSCGWEDYYSIGD